MKLIIASEGIPHRDTAPFPACAATQFATYSLIAQIRDMLAQRHELPFQVWMGKTSYQMLEGEKPSNLTFHLICGPSRADFIAGEWVTRSIEQPEWEAAQYEDLIFYDKSMQIIGALRFARVVKCNPSALLSDRELMEECHAMLKQLLETKL